MSQALLTKPKRQERLITYEEFLEWSGENQHVEWVDGQVIPLSPVNLTHATLSGFLFALIRTFVDAKDRGVVLYEPFNMKTGPTLPGRSPDVLFVDNSHLDRIGRNHLRGPADLVVEVVSPDNPKRDRVEKLAEYETGGIQEYWLIDPQKKEAIFYNLGSDGKYHITPLANGIFNSIALNGLWIDIAWLFGVRMPSSIDIFKRWGLV